MADPDTPYPIIFIDAEDAFCALRTSFLSITKPDLDQPVSCRALRVCLLDEYRARNVTGCRQRRPHSDKTTTRDEVAELSCAEKERVSAQRVARTVSAFPNWVCCA